MRRFYLNRTDDVSGVSGVGQVARGIEFDDGSVAMQWATSHKSIGLYWSIEHVIDIHGHDGRATVDFVDEDFNIEVPTLVNYSVSYLNRFAEPEC
jgi:hypothetical protein